MTHPISFELAKLLKEKGFDIPCIQCYAEERLIDKNTGGDIFTGIYRLCVKSRFHKRYYLAPTISEVVCWIYSKYDIWISVLQMLHNGETVTWYASYYEQGIGEDIEVYYNSPTEAYEAAIKYALNNLL